MAKKKVTGTPQERYAEVVDALIHNGDPKLEVAQKKAFGATGLQVGSKMFAMLSSKSSLVVKLPKERVDALVAAGQGEHFDPGHGRPMKEWLSLSPTADEDWIALATEALKFVASKLE